MPCPHCPSTSVTKRKRRTSLGYLTFSCRTCRRRFNERTGARCIERQVRGDGQVGVECVVGRFYAAQRSLG